MAAIRLDKKMAAEAFKSVDKTEVSIKNAAAYFAMFRADAETIGNLFLNEIANSQGGQRKLLLVYVIHEIIIGTFNIGDEFVKAFGDYLRLYVDQINLTNDSPSIQGFIDILQLWEKKSFYSPNFVKKMRELLQKKLDLMRQDPKVKEQASRQSKNLLKEYQTLSENETSNKIFNLRLEEQEAMKRINAVRQLFEAPQPEHPEVAKRLKMHRAEKIGELQELQEILKRLINDLGQMGKEIPTQSEKIYEEFKGFNLDIVEGYKQRLAQMKEERTLQ